MSWLVRERPDLRCDLRGQRGRRDPARARRRPARGHGLGGREAGRLAAYPLSGAGAGTPPFPTAADNPLRTWRGDRRLTRDRAAARGRPGAAPRARALGAPAGEDAARLGRRAAPVAGGSAAGDVPADRYPDRRRGHEPANVIPPPRRPRSATSGRCPDRTATTSGRTSTRPWRGVRARGRAARAAGGRHRVIPSTRPCTRRSRRTWRAPARRRAAPASSPRASPTPTGCGRPGARSPTASRRSSRWTRTPTHAGVHGTDESLAVADLGEMAEFHLCLAPRPRLTRGCNTAWRGDLLAGGDRYDSGAFSVRRGALLRAMSVRARQRRARQNGSPAKKDPRGPARRRRGRRHRGRRPGALGPRRPGGRPRRRHAEARQRGRQLEGLRRRRQQPRLRPVRHPPHAGRAQGDPGGRSRQATIAIEDENFYEHDGVDVGAIVRAAVENAEAGEIKQGASTITQQLVRNLYIEDPEDSIERKIIEATMAQEYEDEHSKEQILEEYLNTATYGTDRGRSAVGVQAAARGLLRQAGRGARPEGGGAARRTAAGALRVQPVPRPEQAALERRNQVLNAMADQGYITPGEGRRDQASRAPALSAATASRSASSSSSSTTSSTS